MEQIKPVAVYTIEWEGEMAELHMLGDIVCVRWNMTQTPTGWVREGGPYIDFVELRYDEEWGVRYISDYSPVEGGIGFDIVAKVAGELQGALQYARQEGYHSG